jgi:protein TonB
VTQAVRTLRQLRSRPAIVDVVLAVPRAQRHRQLWIAVLTTLGTHASLWFWAQRADRPLDSSAEIAVTVDAELSYVVELAEPPPSQPKTTEPERQAALQKQRVAPRSRVESSEPPPPAAAGAIIAQEPSASAPVDLTGETFIMGRSKAYAGGVTASTGTNTAAVQMREVDPRSPPVTHAAAPDRSSTLSLGEQNWSCPWPREADAEQIDEQTVVIRVVVGAAGNAESVAIVSDPGHGFGQAAATCAMRTRFTPARDREGRAIRAKSPPIRVRFTR